MNEQERNLNNENSENLLDLGSIQADEFDPFGDNDFDDDTGFLKDDSEAIAEKNEKESEQSSPSNPLKNALQTVEKTDIEKTQKSLFSRAPVFDYAGVSEDIEDTSWTFEDLRIQKSEDFPELEDGKRVSWTVEYGKTTKTIPNPKATTIAKMKSDIETSKEFLEQLKKAKDKQPPCKIKPKVTAQSKGIAAAYKGVFTTMEDAVSSEKVISIFPAKDGKVYEMRKNELGKFITTSAGSDLLSDVQAGFTPALPLIPSKLLLEIIGFFRRIARHELSEALVNIYWDKVREEFTINVPKQFVTPVSVESVLSDDFDDNRFIHYMDIHSHNQMNAFFSSTDNRDEKTTRVYAVIGKIFDFFPEIKVRISNGGQHLEIDPHIVFDRLDAFFYYSRSWFDQISVKKTSDFIFSEGAKKIDKQGYNQNGGDGK